MSLVQHGTQTARKRNAAIPKNRIAEHVPSIAIVIWNSDAHVLSRTCPA